MLCTLLIAGPAAATPNMIRLGYPQCQSCHLTPQGGGLLTSYGEGIDLAQTLRPREPDSPEFGEDELGSRLNYDARLSLGIDREPPSGATYGFNTSLRAAAGFMNHRIVYSAGMGARPWPAAGRAAPSASACRGSELAVPPAEEGTLVHRWPRRSSLRAHRVAVVLAPREQPEREPGANAGQGVLVERPLAGDRGPAPTGRTASKRSGRSGRAAAARSSAPTSGATAPSSG